MLSSLRLYNEKVVIKTPEISFSFFPSLYPFLLPLHYLLFLFCFISIWGGVILVLRSLQFPSLPMKAKKQLSILKLPAIMCLVCVHRYHAKLLIR